MENMAKKAISPILLLVLQFESSNTVGGTGLTFCTQVGSDDPTCIDLSKCL